MSEPAKPVVALIPSPWKTRKPPHVPNSPSVSDRVLKNADTEALSFLEDVAYEVDYGQYAARMTIQNFLRTRRLAMQDCFEDIEEETKQMTQQEGVDLKELRAQPEYKEIKDALMSAVPVVNSGSINGEEWAKTRAGKKARRHLERGMRNTSPDMARDAMRAAATVVEIETPKASRIPPQKKIIDFPEEAARTVANAFKEAGITLIGGGDEDGKPPA